MRLAYALSEKSTLQKRTASDSRKSTGIRKRVNYAKSHALCALVAFPVKSKREYSVTRTNLTELLIERWKGIPNGATNYYNLVTKEFASALEETMVIDADLTSNFLCFLSESREKMELPSTQINFAKKIVKLLNELTIKEKIVFKYSVENEVLFIKANEHGNHYLIIGEDDSDLSYGLVGNKIGEYKTIHLGAVNTIEKLVSEFANG